MSFGIRVKSLFYFYLISSFLSTNILCNQRIEFVIGKNFELFFHTRNIILNFVSQMFLSCWFYTCCSLKKILCIYILREFHISCQAWNQIKWRKNVHFFRFCIVFDETNHTVQSAHRNSRFLLFKSSFTKLISKFIHEINFHLRIQKQTATKKRLGNKVQHDLGTILFFKRYFVALCVWNFTCFSSIQNFVDGIFSPQRFICEAELSCHSDKMRPTDRYLHLDERKFRSDVNWTSKRFIQNTFFKISLNIANSMKIKKSFTVRVFRISDWQTDICPKWIVRMTPLYVALR